MQKKVKQLKLNKETVRNLSTDDLKKIAGGTEISVPRSCCRSCIACPSG
jgi:natural product precursor